MATSGQDRWLFTTELGLQAWSYQKDKNPLLQRAFFIQNAAVVL